MVLVEQENPGSIPALSEIFFFSVLAYSEVGIKILTLTC